LNAGSGGAGELVEHAVEAVGASSRLVNRKQDYAPAYEDRQLEGMA
jgi:hypothetical protein